MKRKGVSPLIAAVLLIAFTMALTALLTAWVTQFTKTQQDESEQYQEKIKCSGSNFIINNDFTLYAPTVTGGNLSVRFENIGFNDIWIEDITVWYDERTIPVYLDFEQFNVLEDEDLLKDIDVYVAESGTLSSVDVGDLKKIQFKSTCEGVWFILERPVVGWNTNL
ncbi:MAG: hypothetical protein GQ477_01045 [Nanohaloarchaea archaeon]|nr:hypothetical protein [Candidatus Nanohaloarchaea archaeon]